MKSLIGLIFLIMASQSYCQLTLNNGRLPMSEVNPHLNLTLLTCPTDSVVDCRYFFESFDKKMNVALADSSSFIGLPTCKACDLTALKVQDNISLIRKGVRQLQRVFSLERDVEGRKEIASCAQLLTTIDNKRPTPFCISLSTALMEDPDGDGPRGPMVELWACDFNAGTWDDCVPSGKHYFTFDTIPPVYLDHVYFEDSLYQIDPSVSHYFDKDGFVDWNGEGNIYPQAREETLDSFNEGKIQKWIPESFCASKVFTCADAPVTNAIMSVWDYSKNFEYCLIYTMLAGNNEACFDSIGSNSVVLKRNLQEPILYQNRPNPFFDYTQIEWHLSSPEYIELSIYNLEGKQIFQLNDYFQSGPHNIQLDATNLSARKGVFYYRLKTRESSIIKKMIRLD